ncbi:hypothetical protein HMPREF9520_00895 [Enterococcus faecalis TX1467]|nr:hypothetical protein HMPREF9520_00895 [Enterococcus faecalis TX1467]
MVTVVDRCSRKLLTKVEPNIKAQTVTKALLSLLENEIVYSIS